jgi:hypothetical protein
MGCISIHRAYLVREQIDESDVEMHPFVGLIAYAISLAIGLAVGPLESSRGDHGNLGNCRGSGVHHCCISYIEGERFGKGHCCSDLGGHSVPKYFGGILL